MTKRSKKTRAESDNRQRESEQENLLDSFFASDYRETKPANQKASEPPGDDSPQGQSNDADLPDDEKAEPWVSEEAITGFFDRISDVTSSAFKFAKKTTGTSYKVGKAIIQSQDQLKLMVAAGQSLKDLREVAGLTINELGDAIQLKDVSMLEAVENGTATLSFELILRLSALLARNDPILFILKYTRTYSPDSWKLLSDWGAGRLPLQYQREREFINIYRSKDQARQLTDAGYNQILEFTRNAFNMALHFVAEQEAAVKAAKEEASEAAKDPQQDTPNDYSDDIDGQ